MENEPEKLTVIPERVIYILLKQIMYLQNDFAYFKNNAGLNNSEYGVPEKDLGIKDAGDDTPLQNMDIKGAGTNPSLQDLDIKGAGINPSLQDLGINHLVQQLSLLSGKANAEELLHSLFEYNLISAIKQYITNGNGQNTLFQYYSDFGKAVTQTNAATLLANNAAANLPLEDTYILPKEIPVEQTSITLVYLYLHLNRLLPHNSKQDLYKNVAKELLFLHNNGPSKQTQLREASGISVSGFAKHLPKLIKVGLIKELPKKNYELTEKSINIMREALRRMYPNPPVA